MAATVRVAGEAGPAQVTLTLVLRGTGAHTVLSTGRVTGFTAGHSVTLVARQTGAVEGPGCVETGGPGVTVVKVEAALVNIRT